MKQVLKKKKPNETSEKKIIRGLKPKANLRLDRKESKKRRGKSLHFRKLKQAKIIDSGTGALNVNQLTIMKKKIKFYPCIKKPSKNGKSFRDLVAAFSIFHNNLSLSWNKCHNDDAN